jgi:UDP-glucuronate decarboxylase
VVGFLGSHLIRHYVTDLILLEVDRIGHLACPVSPLQYQFKPIVTAKTSFLVTDNMLGVVRRVGACLLLASTCGVQGHPEVHRRPESCRRCVNTNGIRSCYAATKRIAEILCIDCQSMYGTEIRGTRMFNTYISRTLSDDGWVVSNFIVQALQPQPLTLYGDGSQTGSSCYVGDLYECMIRLMNGSHNGPINIDNPGEFTFRQLAERIHEQSDHSVGLTTRPLPQDDPLQRQPTLAYFRERLGPSS